MKAPESAAKSAMPLLTIALLCKPRRNPGFYSRSTTAGYIQYITHGNTLKGALYSPVYIYIQSTKNNPDGVAATAGVVC